MTLQDLANEVKLDIENESKFVVFRDRVRKVFTPSASEEHVTEADAIRMLKDIYEAYTFDPPFNAGIIALMLGVAHKIQRLYTTAVQYYAQAESIMRVKANTQQQRIMLVRTLLSHGIALKSLKQYAEAACKYDEAEKRLKEECQGAGKEELATLQAHILMSRCILLYRQCKYSEARIALTSALDREPSLPPKFRALMLGNRAQTRYALEDHKGALEDVTAAQALEDAGLTLRDKLGFQILKLKIKWKANECEFPEQESREELLKCEKRCQRIKTEKNLDAYILRASLHIQDKEFERARALLKLVEHSKKELDESQLFDFFLVKDEYMLSSQ